jgi:hypothetical protein
LGHATFGATLFQIMQRFSGGPEMTLQNVLDADVNAPSVAAQSFDFVSDELNGISVDADQSLDQPDRYRGALAVRWSAASGCCWKTLWRGAARADYRVADIRFLQLSLL